MARTTTTLDRLAAGLAAAAAAGALIGLASGARPVALPLAAALAAGALAASLVRTAREAADERQRARLEADRDRSRSEQTARLELLGALLDAGSEGLLAIARDGRVLYANDAAARLLGDRPAESAAARRLGLASLAAHAVDTGLPVEEERDVHVPARRRFALRAAPFAAGALVRIDDVTEVTRAVQVRRDFVANVSHELKTPISGLTLLAEQLTHALAEDPGAARRFADHIHAEADRLGRLVADLLDLSRIESDLPLAAADVGALGLLREAGTRVATLASAREVRLEIEGPEEMRLVADGAQVMTALANLLDNAVRYSPAGTRVRAVVAERNGEVAFVIEDQGQGIPTDELPRIFERFYRVDKARARATGGTGLGLAIVKHVAERHGGRVTAESEYGRGSRFTLLLPSTPPEEGAP